MSEDELIEKAILGDEECIGQLIDKWYSTIRRYCYNCINNATEADDLTQEVFLKVITGIPKYKEKGKFKSWLFKIASNTCKDYYKHRVIDVTILDIENEVVVRDFVDSVNEHDLLKSVLKLLPYKYKESIILHYYCQFTLKEIANILHIPKSTVNTRIRRGLMRLQIILEEDKDEHR